MKCTSARDLCARCQYLYLYRWPSGRPKEARSRDLVIRSMRGGTGVVLLQALAEFSSVATRKLGIGADDVRRRVQAWCTVLPVHAAAEEDFLAALQIVRAHKFQFWDALLCATASRAGVRYLLTEDLQDGRSLRRMTIVDPFAPENNSLIDHILRT